jgi:hypothetical protein
VGIAVLRFAFEQGKQQVRKGRDRLLTTVCRHQRRARAANAEL